LTISGTGPYLLVSSSKLLTFEVNENDTICHQEECFNLKYVGAQYDELVIAWEH